LYRISGDLSITSRNIFRFIYWQEKKRSVVSIYYKYKGSTSRRRTLPACRWQPSAPISRAVIKTLEKTAPVSAENLYNQNYISDIKNFMSEIFIK
jgi:hypothetical protein